MSITVRLQNVVLGYPHLFEKHAFDESSTAKYSAEFTVDPSGTNAEAMRNAMKTVLAAEGKEGYQIHPPWKTGEEINASRAGKGLDPRAEIAGKWVISAKDAKYAPVLRAQDGVTPIGPDQSGNLFGGCVVNALIDVFWSPNPRNPGLYNGLRGVQLVDNVNVSRFGEGREEVVFDPVSPQAPADWM